MTYVNNVINGYANEDNDACRLNHAKFPPEYFDGAHYAKNDRTYAKDSYEADI
jgi:hypothetical protein